MTSIAPAPTQVRAARILATLDTQAPATTTTPWLLMTVGLPGAGKSTFSRELAAATGAIVLESDALRTLLFGTPTHTVTESRSLFDAIYVAAEKLLQSGRSVILDATNLKDSDRRPAYELAARLDMPLLIVRLTAPSRVIERRLGMRSMTDPQAAGLEVYERMRDGEQPLSRPHRQIDTTDAAAYATALAEVIETLRQVPAGRGSMGGRN